MLTVTWKPSDFIPRPNGDIKAAVPEADEPQHHPFGFTSATSAVKVCKGGGRKRRSVTRGAKGPGSTPSKCPGTLSVGGEWSMEVCGVGSTCFLIPPIPSF